LFDIRYSFDIGYSPLTDFTPGVTFTASPLIKVTEHKKATHKIIPFLVIMFWYFLRFPSLILSPK